MDGVKTLNGGLYRRVESARWFMRGNDAVSKNYI